MLLFLSKPRSYQSSWRVHGTEIDPLCILAGENLREHEENAFTTPPESNYLNLHNLDAFVKKKCLATALGNVELRI
jgi:hypothetical protein